MLYDTDSADLIDFAKRWADLGNAVADQVEQVLGILAGENADPWTFPWHELRYQHTARVRRELVHRYAPATVNKMLSALRGVLKNA